MTVQRDLFGGASLIRVWGRIGTAGRQRIDTFVDEGRAAFGIPHLTVFRYYVHYMVGLRLHGSQGNRPCKAAFYA